VGFRVVTKVGKRNKVLVQEILQFLLRIRDSKTLFSIPNLSNMADPGMNLTLLYFARDKICQLNLVCPEHSGATVQLAKGLAPDYSGPIVFCQLT